MYSNHKQWTICSFKCYYFLVELSHWHVIISSRESVIHIICRNVQPSQADVPLASRFRFKNHFIHTYNTSSTCPDSCRAEARIKPTAWPKTRMTEQVQWIWSRVVWVLQPGRTCVSVDSGGLCDWSGRPRRGPAEGGKDRSLLIQTLPKWPFVSKCDEWGWWLSDWLIERMVVGIFSCLSHHWLAREGQVYSGDTGATGGIGTGHLEPHC